MSKFIYENEKTKEISFPLGGIGSGCIGLAGNGQLIDPEIFNRPNKGKHMSFSHFAVKTEKDGVVIDKRVIQGDVRKNITGSFIRPEFTGFGFGVDRQSMAGMPHFSKCRFKGEFPIAKLEYKDIKFPGLISMMAFNPFIPTNEDDSSIPGAFFEFELTNTTAEELDYSIAYSQANLYCGSCSINKYVENDRFHGIHMTNNLYSKDDVRYGDMTIATDAEDVSHQLYWYRGKWFDNITTFWQDFNNSHRIKNREYKTSEDKVDNYACNDVATLVAHIKIKPQKTKKVRFILTWNTPNCYNYWSKEYNLDKEKPQTWKNYYAVMFENSLASAKYAILNYEKLFNATNLFKKTLLSSSLPEAAVEAVSANLSVMKSPTVLRLDDGSLYGWEGCHTDKGSCEGTCTHVWSYTYAIAFLFPRLERSMRTLEYTYSMNDDGGMVFRLMLPIGSPRSKFRPCVDGQYGTVMRVYREFKISGDIDWLRSIWNEVKRSIEFAWSEYNIDAWDINKDGLMEGRQHHTLDMELFGHNAWLSGMYLGGLKAGVEMAKILGDSKAEKEYYKIYEKGRKTLNDTLFNGEYFSQIIDLKDKSLLDQYHDGVSIHGEDVYEAYWNKEQQEIMYQIGDGCEIDQVLAQWHANLIGLGEIFDKDKTKRALDSIYKYNFVDSVREHTNPCRIYCLNDEGGLLISVWPKGRQKGFIPLPYSEEMQNGYEYAAAVQMIQSGLIDEGMNCVRSIRDRYDGEKRNPWNEFECGSNYARSMASFSLLLSFSGFVYNAYENLIGFKPITDDKNFNSFWSLDSGWGQVDFSTNQVVLKLMYGELKVKKLMFKKAGLDTPKAVEIDGKSVDFKLEQEFIVLDNITEINDSVYVFY